MYNSSPQPIDLGEKTKTPVPDPLRNNKDLLLEDIAKFKRYANRDDTPDEIMKTLTRGEEEIETDTSRWGIL